MQGWVVATADIVGFGGPTKVVLGVKQSFCPDTYFFFLNRPFTKFCHFLVNQKCDFFRLFKIFPICARIDQIYETMVLEHHNHLKECIFSQF